MPSPEDPATQPGEPELIEILAHLYRATDWAAIGGKSTLDIWGGRVLVASRAGTIGELVNRLATTLRLAHLPAEVVPLIAACRPHERALLRLLATETIPLATAGYLRAREIRADRKASREAATA